MAVSLFDLPADTSEDIRKPAEQFLRIADTKLFQLTRSCHLLKGFLFLNYLIQNAGIFEMTHRVGQGAGIKQLQNFLIVFHDNVYFYPTKLHRQWLPENSDHSSFFMATDIRHQLQRHRDLMAGYACHVSDADYSAFERSKALLLRLAQVENSALAVYDMNRKNYALIHSKFSSKLQFDLNAAYSQGPAYFFALMPPDDLAFAVDSEIRTFEFLDSLPPDARKDYKLIFEFRLQDPQGRLYRFLQQNVVLEQDVAGAVWMVLILNDLIPEPSGAKPLQRSLIHMKSGRQCLFENDALTRKGRILTDRELEILGLISEGLQSRQISDRLFISVNTVNNHRQRIIEKTGTAGTAEALAYARTLGLL